jgi:hypothetical protein
MLPVIRGDCLTCVHLSTCNETSVERVKVSYTCALFTAVDEAVYMARLHMMNAYGEDAAIEAMLERPPEPEEDEEPIEEDEGESEHGD